MISKDMDLPQFDVARNFSQYYLEFGIGDVHLRTYWFSTKFHFLGIK